MRSYPKLEQSRLLRVASAAGDEQSIYHLTVLWHYIQQELLVAGMARSKFHNLGRLAQLVLTFPHSSADKERVFSRIGKNKMKFRTNLSLNHTLPSIITFQMNRPAGCIQTLL